MLHVLYYTHSPMKVKESHRGLVKKKNQSIVVFILLLESS